MDYKIVVTKDAEEDLDRYILYLLREKKNNQAAKNVLDDFEATKKVLSKTAGIIKPCENPSLMAQGYRRINFLSHK